MPGFAALRIPGIVLFSSALAFLSLFLIKTGTPLALQLFAPTPPA